MPKILRVRCPLCAMMVDVEKIKGPVAEIRLYLQEFGGKRPSGEYEKIPKGKGFIYLRKKEFAGRPARGRGRTRGYMNYTDITETEAKEFKAVVRFIKNKIKEIKL